MDQPFYNSYGPPEYNNYTNYQKTENHEYGTPSVEQQYPVYSQPPPSLPSQPLTNNEQSYKRYYEYDTNTTQQYYPPSYSNTQTYQQTSTYVQSTYNEYSTQQSSYYDNNATDSYQNGYATATYSDSYPTSNKTKNKESNDNGFQIPTLVSTRNKHADSWDWFTNNKKNPKNNYHYNSNDKHFKKDDYQNGHSEHSSSTFRSNRKRSTSPQDRYR